MSNLQGALADTARLVNAFCAQNGESPSAPATVEFPGVLRNNDDFVRLNGKLEQVDQQRRELKEALVTRFEALVKTTEAKLRAHAAALAPAPPASVPSSAPVAASPPRPTPPPADQVETLYSGQLSNYDIQQKTNVLDRGKDFLKVLETSAENPDNRKTLTDSMSQLDALLRLLPAKIEAPALVEQPVVPERRFDAPAPRRELNAEKVADQLARLRGSVRQTTLTTWTLDAAYAQASDLANGEQARCRLATLTVKGIWVAAFGQLGVALLATIFGAFLILVLADFMQTLLDTATNTGVMASATDPR